MARRPFGGTPADFVARTVGGNLQVGTFVITLWTAKTGGLKVTDLLDSNGSAAVQISTDASGQVPSFQGPNDGTAVLWADAGGSSRQLMQATDVDARFTALPSTFAGLPSTSVWTSGALTVGVNTVDASGGAKTPSLPTPTVVGQLLSVEKTDTSANTVTISGTIRGSSSSVALVYQYESIVFEAESLTSWRPFAGHKTLAQLNATYEAYGSAAWLIGRALSQAFRLTANQVYDTSFGTLTASDIAWPDGTTGHYATTGLDTAGAVTGFTVTYVGATTKTVTVVVPRNASSQVSGAMTAAVA